MNIKLITDPFNYIKVYAVRLVNFIIKHNNIIIPVYATYLNVTSDCYGHSNILNILFLFYIR